MILEMYTLARVSDFPDDLAESADWLRSSFPGSRGKRGYDLRVPLSRGRVGTSEGSSEVMSGDDGSWSHEPRDPGRLDTEPDRVARVAFGVS